MSSRSTILLVLAAIVLSAYGLWSERSRTLRVVSPTGAIASFLPVQPSDIDVIEILREKTLLRVERTNTGWNLVLPVRQRAEAETVDAFLDALQELRPEGYLSAAEIQASPELEQSLGLDSPDTLRISVDGRSGPSVYRIGNRAPMGPRFFFQRLGDGGVFSANQRFLDIIPESANDWRDHALLSFETANCNRIEVQQRGVLSFEAVRRSESGWQLRQPLSARGDGPRLLALIHQLQRTHVVDFIHDAPPYDDPKFGLQPPLATCILRDGTNIIAHLEFGSELPDIPSLRYVHRVDHGSLMLVPASTIDVVSQPVNQFRDRRMIANVDDIDQVQLAGPNGFVVARQGTNWHVLSPVSTLASSSAMDSQLYYFGSLEIAEFVNDVITDLTRYGFDKPAREYSLLRGTNIISQIQIGNPLPNGVLVYARRLDEPAVYAVPRSAMVQLAASHLQLRETAFDPSQVARILIQRKGESIDLTRARNGRWTRGDTPLDPVGALAVDESLHRLGSFVSDRYLVDQPDVLRKTHKIDVMDHAITIEFHSGAPLRAWRLELGGQLGPRLAALAYFDEDPTPVQLFLPTDVAEAILTNFVIP